MGVDDHALALVDKTDDGVARDRFAALRELHRHVLRAADHDRGAGLALIARGIAEGQQAARDHRAEPLAKADVGQDVEA